MPAYVAILSDSEELVHILTSDNERGYLTVECAKFDYPDEIYGEYDLFCCIYSHLPTVRTVTREDGKELTENVYRNKDRWKEKQIKDICERHPGEFGLRSYPGDLFRCNRSASYWSEVENKPLIYIDILNHDGVWRNFCKDTEAMLIRYKCEAPKQ